MNAEPAAKTANRPKFDHWGPTAAILVSIAVYLVPQFVVVISFGILGGVLKIAPDELSELYDLSTTVQFVLTLVTEIISLALLWMFLRNYKQPLHSLGFTRRPAAKDIGSALVGFGIYFVLYLLLVAGIQSVVPGLDTEQEQDIGFDNAIGLQLILVFFSLVVVPPLVEEILFRGFLYRGLKCKWPVLVSALITSLLFGALHLQFGNGQPLLWIAAIDTFALSMILIYLRDRTGALWASIFLHALKNLLAFLFLFVFNVDF